MVIVVIMGNQRPSDQAGYCPAQLPQLQSSEALFHADKSREKSKPRAGIHLCYIITRQVWCVFKVNEERRLEICTNNPYGR